MLSISYSRKASLIIVGTLFTSAACYAPQANADASLDELKAKLERAEKENIVLKTEKLERENVTMKLEKIEAENAALRNEARIDKTPTASIAAKQHIAAPAPQVKTIAHRAVVETNDSPQRDSASTKAINKSLAAIPKDDERRDMTAVHKAQISSEIISEKPWQGVYAGINAGYAANDVNINTSTVGNAAGTLNYTTSNGPVFSGGSTSNYFSGPVVGGQVGYNHEFNNHVILGAESDVDWADVNNNSITNTNNWNYTIAPSASANVSQITSNNNRIGLDWVGTTRLRLGYSFGKFMPYLTGGVAYGQLSSNGAISNLFGFGGTGYSYQYGNSGGASYSAVKAGWALGTGAEYKVAENISVKAEYLYTQLGGLNGATYSTSSGLYTCGGCTPPGATGSGPLLTQSSMSAFGIHQARVGLNYHTGWLGAAPTVTAKY